VMRYPEAETFKDQKWWQDAWLKAFRTATYAGRLDCFLVEELQAERERLVEKGLNDLVFCGRFTRHAEKVEYKAYSNLLRDILTTIDHTEKPFLLERLNFWNSSNVHIKLNDDVFHYTALAKAAYQWADYPDSSLDEYFINRIKPERRTFVEQAFKEHDFQRLLDTTIPYDE